MSAGSPTAHSTSNDDRPALLGGTPVRPGGPPAWPLADPQVQDVLHQLAQDGSWGRYHGPHCQKLIEKLAEMHAAEHVILCSSGTAAVELALRGLRVGERAGDEVVLAAYDFKGNFQDVLAVGATPVLVDVDAANWQFDLQHLEAAVSGKTRAVIVSHLHGAIAPAPEISEWAAARGIGLIEDACQMPGALVQGRPAGMWGDAAVLSFGGSKLLSAGRGGAILTNRAEIAQRIRLYTQRGNEAYPLSEMQAAVLLPQLQQLPERNRLRAERAAQLRRLIIQEQPGLHPFHQELTDDEPGYYKLGFRYESEAFAGLPRDLFARAMRAEGIALDPGFRALHATHSPRRFRAAGSLDNATQADAQVLTLHHPVLLEDETALQQIATAVDKIRRSATMLLERFNT